MKLVPLEEWYPEMAARGINRTKINLTDREAWIIHHTVGGDVTDPLVYARAVADFHYGKWGVPGGYNFLVGTDGVIREMCGWDYEGVHSGSNYWNENGLGLSFQGTYTNKVPSDIMLQAAGELIGSFSLPQKSHREVRPTYTTCPGDALIAELPIKEGNMALTAHEEDVVKDIVAALDAVGSNGTALKYMVLHLRDHPDAGTVDQTARNLANKALAALNAVLTALKNKL